MKRVTARAAFLDHDFPAGFALIQPAQTDRVADQIEHVPEICDRREEAANQIAKQRGLQAYSQIIETRVRAHFESFTRDPSQFAERHDDEHCVAVKRSHPHLSRHLRIRVVSHEPVVRHFRRIVAHANAEQRMTQRDVKRSHQFTAARIGCPF